MSKTILITGCSSGFGYHTAILLAKSGYSVHASVRKSVDIAKLKLAIGNLPLSIFQLDVTWPQAKINRIVAQIGHIDVLVNNAGFGYLGATESFTITELEDQFSTNFFGAFKMFKAVLPSMRKRRAGLIININSISGLATTAFYGVYSASKFALEALTTSLRAEESLFGVQVISVNPGSFATNFWSNSKSASKIDPEISRLNTKFLRLVNHPLHRRPHPSPVPATIKSIIESSHPRKNYIVGFEANVLFFLHRLLPLSFQDWLVKLFIRKFSD